MAISATYITLQRQIADELIDSQHLLSVISGSSLTLSPIQNAIQSAVSKWEREPFYFNEVYSTPLFTTVNAQEFYTSADAAAIATTPEIYQLHALINANRYALAVKSWAELDVVSVNPSATGEPQDYAVFASQIRLYPIPNGAYPIRASRTQKITALSADNDTNVWTQDAFDLIRSEAKLILAEEVIHDDDLAVRMRRAIYGVPGVGGRGYLGALRAETFRRARSRIKPSQF